MILYVLTFVSRPTATHWPGLVLHLLCRNKLLNNRALCVVKMLIRWEKMLYDHFMSVIVEAALDLGCAIV